LNFDSETGANMIGDDSTPTLEFSNTSTGPGVQTDTLVASSGATIVNANLSTAVGTAAANSTIAGLRLTGTSIASGAVIQLVNNSAFVSTTTIKANTAVAANTGAIRILKPDGTFGYIPVYASGDVTAVAV